MPEVGLVTVVSKIKCYSCGKKGHKAFQCKEPKKRKKGKKMSNKKCNRCGNKGHDKDNCWDDPKNADKVPAWYRQKKEAVKTKINAETGLFCGKAEVLSMANDEAIHFLQMLELLLDPDVWVADTSASCGSTGHVFGLNNKCMVPREDGVTLPAGSKKTATMIANLEALVCDRQGNVLYKALMKN
eukprot:9670410-Ditylum_brightwellii.AAC.1